MTIEGARMNGQVTKHTKTDIVFNLNVGYLLVLKLYPFMPSGLLYLYSLDWSITSRRGPWLIFIITI